MPRNREAGQSSSSDALLREFEKPLGQRNKDIVESIDDAISFINLINWRAKRDGASEIQRNNLEVDFVVDTKGNIVGLKVK